MWALVFPFRIPSPYTMKKKIIDYLEGPRNLAEGIALVLAHSSNVPLVRNLQRRRQDSPYAGAVFEELRKMAGLTTFAFLHLKRHAKRPPELDPSANGLNPSRTYIDEKPNASPQAKAQPSPQEPTAKPVSDTLQKMINFRKRFPFLNDPKCPDILKILVSDMFTAYGKYRVAHQQLTQVPDDKMAPELTATVLDNFLEDRAIMAELEYYRDNGQLLGKHPKVAAQGKPDEISSMSDFDLAKALKNAMSNISKCRVVIENGKASDSVIASAKERLPKWTARKEAIQAEIDRRSSRN